MGQARNSFMDLSHGYPPVIIHWWDFPWNKPSSYWGTSLLGNLQFISLNVIIIMALHIWLVVWNIWIIFPIILGMSSSHLTNSYFSEGSVNHQPDHIWILQWDSALVPAWHFAQVLRDGPSRQTLHGWVPGISWAHKLVVKWIGQKNLGPSEGRRDATADGMEWPGEPREGPGDWVVWWEFLGISWDFSEFHGISMALKGDLVRLNGIVTMGWPTSETPKKAEPGEIPKDDLDRFMIHESWWWLWI